MAQLLLSIPMYILAIVLGSGVVALAFLQWLSRSKLRVMRKLEHPHEGTYAIEWVILALMLYSGLAIGFGGSFLLAHISPGNSCHYH